MTYQDRADAGLLGQHQTRRELRGRSSEFAAGAAKPPRILQKVKGQATDEVHMTDVTDLHDDESLAKHAGYDRTHQGYNVKRYPDSADASVHLWKQ